MKRHRLLLLDFDSRAHILGQSISSDWDEDVQALHRRGQADTRNGLIAEFGELHFEAKFQNFMDLGAKSFSVVSYHNRFYDQVRRAFVVGSYYAALVGSCALGERILNHLVLSLRDDYRSQPTYKKVHGKESFDDWAFVTSTLQAWGVLREEAVTAFRELESKRHAAVHFKPEVDENDRELALGAIKCLGQVIDAQFAGFGALPWLLTSVPGETYICKSWENAPFVRKYYLPACAYVGPKHEVVAVFPKWQIDDGHTYEEREVADEEFVHLRTGGASSS